MIDPQIVNQLYLFTYAVFSETILFHYANN